MSYWGKLCDKCELCGTEWHREHLFLDCKFVEEWEKQVYKDKFQEMRTERKNALLNHLSPNHTFSWIYNWTIWKTYWEIIHLKFDDCFNTENQIEKFRKLLKFNEYLHLKFSTSTLHQNKMKTVSTETNLFYFYSLNPLHQNSIENKKR